MGASDLQYIPRAGLFQDTRRSHSQTYTFDAMGNRATKVNDGASESYTVNAANMLLTRGANSYTNDLNGNTFTGGGRTNTWDSQNWLYQCVNGSTTTVNTYAADEIRHRTASTVSGTTTTRDYVLDNSMFIREQTPVNGIETNVTTYLVGPRGPEYRRDDSNGSIRWYCYDGLGSVLGEVNPSGTLTATRSYDVYGGVRTSAGTSTSKHKFVGALGHPSDDETGLIYMRARYMDPVTGRFVREDPARDGRDWYIYVHNNPINLTDSTGKFIDILFSLVDGGIENGRDAAISNAVKEWDADKIKSALAREMGRIVGYLLSEELDAYGGTNCSAHGQVRQTAAELM